VISTNETNNTAEPVEHNNNLYFRVNTINESNGEGEDRHLFTPNPNSNFTTPSTMTPLFQSSAPSTNSVNNQSVTRFETYTPSNYPTVSNVISSGNANVVDSSYRDSYRLQNTTYLPNSYTSNSYAPNSTQSTSPSIPLSPAPVTAPVPVPAQDNNGPISSQP